YASPAETASQRAMRDRERTGALEILELARNKPAAEQVFSEAVHRFLGTTNCMLAMTQLDDLLAEQDPVNVPGTSSEHPNWRRKYSATIEDVASEHHAWRLFGIMRAAGG